MHDFCPPQVPSDGSAEDSAAATADGSTFDEEADPAAGNDALEQQDFAEASPDSQGPRPRQTAVIEQCIAWGGEQRVRFQVTLACEGASL